MHAHMPLHAHAGIHTNPIILSPGRLCALIFLISKVEESRQPTKNANKIILSIFLIMKATILDTHGKNISQSITCNVQSNLSSISNCSFQSGRPIRYWRQLKQAIIPLKISSFRVWQFVEKITIPTDLNSRQKFWISSNFLALMMMGKVYN